MTRTSERAKRRLRYAPSIARLGVKLCRNIEYRPREIRLFQLLVVEHPCNAKSLIHEQMLKLRREKHSIATVVLNRGLTVA